MSKCSRSCVGCGDKRMSDYLLRFVRIDGKLNIDIEQRKKGRGAYCCIQLSCLQSGLQKGLNRSFRQDVSGDFKIEDLVEAFKVEIERIRNKLIQDGRLMRVEAKGCRAVERFLYHQRCLKALVNDLNNSNLEKALRA